MQNQNNNKITMEAELPVALEELARYTLPKKAEPSSIVDLLNTKPFLVNYIMGKIVRRFIKKKNPGLKMKSLEYHHMDSDNLTHGLAYFKVILEGEERLLQRIIAKDKLFFFELKKIYIQNQSNIISQ